MAVTLFKVTDVGTIRFISDCNETRFLSSIVAIVKTTRWSNKSSAIAEIAAQHCRIGIFALDKGNSLLSTLSESSPRISP